MWCLSLLPVVDIFSVSPSRFNLFHALSPLSFIPSLADSPLLSLSLLIMIAVVTQDPRFADAEDEEEYQAGRSIPLLRDNKTCRLKEVESSDLVKFEPPLYIQRYARVSWSFAKIQLPT